MRDRELILRIPLSIRNVIDSLYWWPDKKGQFKVKDAYQLLTHQDSLWRDHNMDTFWMKLWKLNIPPRVKDFMWRVESSCLPTKERLIARHIEVDPLCCVSNNASESEVHIMWECSYARDCWNEARWANQVVTHSSLGSLFSSVFQNSSHEQCVLFSVICYTIWKHRNEVFWEGKHCNTLNL